MSRHRLEKPRPRYGRGGALVLAVTATLVAVVGGLGIVPTTVLGVSAGAGMSAGAETFVQLPDAEAVKRVAAEIVLDAPVTIPPADSGDGKRVVFSQEQQRVWLVDADNQVLRTYLVSGSVYDNLDKGTYAVFSRSAKAQGIDDSGTMNLFVRFAHGENAAIGFHDIPVHEGEEVQTEDELGTPLSHGCIRQAAEDAEALWEFAPVGTTVVVI